MPNPFSRHLPVPTPKLTDLVLRPPSANKSPCECWRINPKEDERIHNFRVMITVANEG